MNRSLLVAAAALSIAVAALALWWLKPWRDVPEDAALFSELDAAIERAGKPWSRPVVRGEAEDGDAQAQQAAAVLSMLTRLPKDWASEDFWAALGDKSKYADLIGELDAPLDELLASAQRSHAWRPVPLTEVYTPEVRFNRAGYRLLLLRASRKDPSTCLQRVADVWRLAGDLAAGIGALGIVNLNPVAGDLKNTLMNCSRVADKVHLTAARDELLALLRAPIPLGSALEHELITLTVMMRKLAGGGYALDDDSRILWRFNLESVEVMRELTTQDYPRVLDVGAERMAALKTLGLPEEVAATYDTLLTRYLENYAYAEAYLRMMIISLEAQISGERRSPPASAASKELCDPFTGKPMVWMPIKNCAAIVTVGANKKNDSEVQGTTLQRNEDDGSTFACFEPP